MKVLWSPSKPFIAQKSFVILLVGLVLVAYVATALILSRTGALIPVELRATQTAIAMVRNETETVDEPADVTAIPVIPIAPTIIAAPTRIPATRVLSQPSVTATLEVPSTTPTPTASATQMPTSTPSPSPTWTPSVTPTPTSTSAPTPTVEPTPAPGGEVVTERLNVRSGPGTEYEVVDQVTEGTRFNVLAKCTNARDELWLMIDVTPDEQQRWVSGSTRYVSHWNTDNLICVKAPRPVTDPHFRADQMTIRAGECTTLRWDVEGIREVYLDGHGQVGHASTLVCPTQAQTFTLKIVERDGREILHPLTITVSGQVSGPVFIIDHQGCIGGIARDIGQVKGQIFDQSGRIIAGAVVEVFVEGLSGIVPPSTSDGAGWYGWNFTPGQTIRFKSLKVGGRPVAFSPPNFEVNSVGGCYQRVDFKQR